MRVYPSRRISSVRRRQVVVVVAVEWLVQGRRQEAFRSLAKARQLLLMMRNLLEEISFRVRQTRG